jgi:hypothetical protein
MVWDLQHFPKTSIFGHPPNLTTYTTPFDHYMKNQLFRTQGKFVYPTLLAFFKKATSIVPLGMNGLCIDKKCPKVGKTIVGLMSCV